MKKQRQEAIVRIINDYVIETQDDLLVHLKTAGFDVTQATVSRDMKELRLLKALDSQNNYRYMLPKHDIAHKLLNYSDIFSGAVINVDYAMNDVVLKCHSGMANAACAALDQMLPSSVVGTLAGDDTILVIARTVEQAEKLARDFKKILSER